MENEIEYQNILSMQSRLQDAEDDRLLNKKHEEATKLIEDHFEKALIHLATRKYDLLKLLADVYIERSNTIKKYHGDLRNACEKYQKIKEMGESFYVTNRECAVAIWKSARLAPPCAARPELDEISVDLPVTIFDVIKNHGTVGTPAKMLPMAGYQSSQSFRSSRSFPEEMPHENLPRKSSQASDSPPILEHPSINQPAQGLSQSEVVTTFAGSKAGFAEGIGINAKICRPRGIFFHPDDRHLYVCDNGNRVIRKISMQGEVSSLSLQNSVSQCKFASPTGIAIFFKENMIFVTDKTNHTIKTITPGVVKLYAGTGTKGSKDGEKEKATFCSPSGISVDQQTGTVYISDKGSHTIRKISPAGIVSTIAGTPGKSGFTDGPAKIARFDHPKGVWYSEKHKALFVCDFGNHRLRKIDMNDGSVTTVDYEIKGPHNVMVLDDTTILVTSYYSNKIIKLTYQNEKFEGSVLAGSGKQGEENGTPAQSSFNRPYGIAFDSSSNTCFVADYRGHTIRKLGQHEN